MRRAAVVLVAVVACGQDARTTAAIAARQAAEAEAAKRAAAVRAVPDGTGVARATGHTLDAATLLREVFGATPGLGPLFAGVQLGAPASGFLPDDARARIEAFKAATGATVEFAFGDRLDRIVVSGEVADPIDPALVRSELTARWGRPIPLGDDDQAWLDEATSTRMRMTVVDDTITIGYEAYATLRRLIAPANPDRFGFEPVPLLGRPVAEVLPSLPGALRNGWHLTWRMPPLADGVKGLELFIGLDRAEHVNRLVAELPAAECDPIRATVAIKFGRAPAVDDDGQGTTVARWRAVGRTTSVGCSDGVTSIVVETR